MSYDVYFQKNGENCILDSNMVAPTGGTYCVNCNEAWLNITFNYSSVFKKKNFGIIAHDDDSNDMKVLNGKTAKECVKILNDVIPLFADDVDSDYWKATEGNAKNSLKKLLQIAENVPADSKCVVYY